MAGRGFGKTRSGAEWVCEQAKDPGQHIAIVGPTVDDARKVMLSAGLETSNEASGILKIAPSDFRPTYEPSKRIVTWPNGTVGTVYSAEEPDRLRGPQHHKAWVDEIAAWSKNQSAWDMLMFGLRLGDNPQACITTTPRPVKLLKDLLEDKDTVVTTGSTYDNRANLASKFFDRIVSKYEGTRLGRQELWAELLEDIPGALWKRSMLDMHRVHEHPVLSRIVVGVDPAVTSNQASDETGIIVAGVGMCTCQGVPDLHGFVLADGSGVYTPLEWSQEVVSQYNRYRADRVIAEVNNGGDLVEANVRTTSNRISYASVRATRGKAIRAEPIAALYEQGKIHHVGPFNSLEDQMCCWDPTTPGSSPDRMDALVWAFTELLLGDAIPVYGGYESVSSSRWS